MVLKKDKFIVDDIYNGKRLDIYLSFMIEEHSRSYLQKLVKNGFVKVNNILIKYPKNSVFKSDVIDIQWPEEQRQNEIVAEDFKYNILYEDEYLMVIDKPAGVVVHPAVGNREGTIVNALIGKDSGFANKMLGCNDDILAAQRPGIVHRLDKDTSGCLIIAKDIQSKNKLSEAFANRTVKKSYYAITYGYPQDEKGSLITLIGRHPVNRKKMSVVEKNGKEALTDYEVMKKGRVDNVNIALLKVNIHTGRTHQIRVHLAYLKAPVLGDETYGGSQKIKVERQMLHAGIISFPHPKTGEMIKVISQYPEDFQEILNRL